MTLDPSSKLTGIALSEEELRESAVLLDSLVGGLRGVLFGQDALIDHAVLGILARGHLLLEGLPGLGKTELVKGLAKSLGLGVRRVQFTPDLLPGDITGNPVLQELNGRREFVFQPGPIFSNILIADEINRASPKTQSALLEAMQERKVTAGGQSHLLPDPFFVLATQNPIELEGTYPLPEAQLDRFLFKLEVDQVSAETLQKIVQFREIGVEPDVAQVCTRDELAALFARVRRVHLPEVVANYIARLVSATHPGEFPASSRVRYGASPRAALALAAAAKARGLRFGRGHASVEDVQAIAQPVLCHRVILDHVARMDGVTTKKMIEELLTEVPVQSKPLPRSLSTAKIS